MEDRRFRREITLPLRTGAHVLRVMGLVAWGCSSAPEPEASAPGAGSFAPAVPDLPPPPEFVLAAQWALPTLPDGFLRNGDGRIYSEKDGAEMVLVPAGEFTMGDDSSDEPNERPAHRVFVSQLLVDRHEVTNAQFARFVRATGYRTDAEKEGKGFALIGDDWAKVAGADWKHPEGPGTSIRGLDAIPVVLVSWNDSRAYGDWVGRRLPTEAELERCLRGGMEAKRYPWGDADTPSGKPGNYADEALQRKHPSFTRPIAGYDDGIERTSRAGAFEQCTLGLFDVSGNVWEWCSDAYSSVYYDTLSGSVARDPQGPSSSSSRVLRGGSWRSGPFTLRCACRFSTEPADRAGHIGFRTVRSLP